MNLKVGKRIQREKRKRRIRGKVKGTASRPRLTVFKSNKHLYAQAIDDSKGITVAAASSLSKRVVETLKEDKEATIVSAVGETLGDIIIKRGIKSVVFDRNGYAYHGKVKALADKVREQGIIL